MRYLISCIEKSSPQGGHEHITRAGSRGWTMTIPQLVARIDSGVDSFYVEDDYGRRATVGVVRPAGRHPYIRTYADGVWTDNLLALAACLI